MKRLPDLEGWAVFATVAEAGSFSRAASELGITQATVSKTVSRLEARLKTTLFHRTSRRLSLTASGLAAQAHAAHILAEGEAVEAAITAQSATLRGLVRVAAPMSFGITHLAPLLPAFMQRYPDVTLEVHFDDALVDLVGDGYDVGVRIGALADSSLLARSLCSVRLRLVGAPAYFARRGTPAHPRDLLAHHLLFYVYSRHGNAWRFHHQRHGDYSVGIAAALRVNNAEALTPALLAGLGLALQPEFLVWRELGSGTLVSVMDDWAPPPIALHVVTPPSRLRPARVGALIDFLASRFATPPWAAVA